MLAVALALSVLGWLVHRAQRGAAATPAAEPAAAPAHTDTRLLDDPIVGDIEPIQVCEPLLPSTKSARIAEPLLHSSKTITLPPSPEPPELLFGSKSGPVPADPQPRRAKVQKP